MVLKNNKKAWLRILEAFIGIMLVAGVLIFVVSNQTTENSNSAYIEHLQSSILDEISLNESLRIAVLSKDIITINETINKRIPSNLEFDVKICELEQEVGCKAEYVEKETYNKDKIIVSNLTQYSPKKVRLTIWTK